jgi:hypothetical protein
MEEHLNQRLVEVEQKLAAIYTSTEKTRKYLLIIMWSSLAMVLAPLLIAAIIGPIIIESFTASLGL